MISRRPIPAVLKLGLATAITGYLFLVLTGVDFLQALRLLAVLAIQVATGAIIWSAVRRGQAGAVEVLGMGLALGPVLCVVTGLAVNIAGLGNWGWMLPAGAALLVLVIRRRDTAATHLLHAEPELLEKPSLWAIGVTFVLGLGSLIPNLLNYPLMWTGTAGNYHPDMLFFEALSTSLTRFGPFESIFTPDSEVHYHWLVYAWAGQVTSATDAAPFVVLTRVLPFVAIASSCLIAIAWVARLTSIRWAPSLAVVLLIMGGFVGATYGAIFNFDSPSQAMTAAWILAFGLGFVVLLSEQTQGRTFVISLTIAIGIMAFGLTGGKISAGLAAVAGILFVTAAGILLHLWWWKRALLATATSTAMLLAAYLGLVAGSADSGGLRLGDLVNRASSVQGLNPLPSSIGIILGTVILVIAICIRWSGLVWFLTTPARRREPSTLLGLGLALAAILAILVLSNGVNETWFALAAAAPLAVISASGAADAANAVGLNLRSGRGAILIIVASAAVLFGLAALLWATGASGGDEWVSTLRWLGPLVSVAGAIGVALVLARRVHGYLSVARASLALSVVILVLVSAPARLIGVGTGQVGVQPGLNNDAFSPVEPIIEVYDPHVVGQWSDAHAAAAAWVRMHTGESDLLATNITRSALVPALTRRQTIASGVLYQAAYGPPSMVQAVADRERTSWYFIEDPSDTTARPLCDAGVDWLWVDPARTKKRSWSPYAEIVFANDAAIILRVNQERCT